MSRRVAIAAMAVAVATLGGMLALAEPVDSELRPGCPANGITRDSAAVTHARSVPRRQEPEPREVARWLAS